MPEATHCPECGALLPPGHPRALYLVVHRRDRMLIGLGAVREESDADGAVKIANGFAPDCRGRGFATEVVRALTGEYE